MKEKKKAVIKKEARRAISVWQTPLFPLCRRGKKKNTYTEKKKRRMKDRYGRKQRTSHTYTHQQTSQRTKVEKGLWILWEKKKELFRLNLLRIYIYIYKEERQEFFFFLLLSPPWHTFLLLLFRRKKKLNFLFFFLKRNGWTKWSQMKKKKNTEQIIRATSGYLLF